jgi:sensor c-di-GMP phosphodiesterase-like protein
MNSLSGGFTHNFQEELETAIQDDEFGFLYQPICELTTGLVVGYEALARWFRSDGTVLSPAMFLPWLENSALEKAWIASQIRILANVFNNLPDNIWVSYNLSESAMKAQYKLPAIPKRLADNLHIEIIEAVNLDTPNIINRIKWIHSCGHKIYADDIGQGYSLPTILADIPLDGIKLDKILVDGIPEDTDLCILISGILAWANSKSIVTVAEWIQTEEQVQWLIDSGCQLGQGSLYGLAQRLPFSLF